MNPQNETCSLHRLSTRTLRFKDLMHVCFTHPVHTSRFMVKHKIDPMNGNKSSNFRCRLILKGLVLNYQLKEFMF